MFTYGQNLVNKNESIIKPATLGVLSFEDMNVTPFYGF
jgi:hypothetical protein